MGKVNIENSDKKPDSLRKHNFFAMKDKTPTKFDNKDVPATERKTTPIRDSYNGLRSSTSKPRISQNFPKFSELNSSRVT